MLPCHVEDSDNMFCVTRLVKLKQIIRNLRSNNEVGKLLLMELLWNHLLTGFGYDLMKDVHRHVDYVPPNWWSGMR